MIKHINGVITRVPHGMLAKDTLGLVLELTVLRSGAGWYLGTFDHGGPVSRESLEYYQTEDMAKCALNTQSWTQRTHT